MRCTNSTRLTGSRSSSTWSITFRTWATMPATSPITWAGKGVSTPPFFISHHNIRSHILHLPPGLDFTFIDSHNLFLQRTARILTTGVSMTWCSVSRTTTYTVRTSSNRMPSQSSSNSTFKNNQELISTREATSARNRLPGELRALQKWICRWMRQTAIPTSLVMLVNKMTRFQELGARMIRVQHPEVQVLMTTTILKTSRQKIWGRRVSSYPQVLLIQPS